MASAMRSLAIGAAALSFFAPVLYLWLVAPVVQNMFATALPYVAWYGGVGNKYGIFAVYPLYLIIALGFWYAWRETKKYAAAGTGSEQPYMSGIQATKDGAVGFTGPMKRFVEVKSSNYYLEFFFGEGRLTSPANYAALVLFGLLLGGVLQ